MEVVDLDHLDDLGGLSSPELVGILREFLARLPQDAAELAAAISRQETAEVRDLAHRFKGAAGNAGFPELRDLGETFETLAATGAALPSPAEVSGLLDVAIRRASESFEEAVRAAAL